MKKENTIIVALAVLAAIIAATWLTLVAPAYTGNKVNMTPAATAVPITPATLGPSACINKKLL